MAKTRRAPRQPTRRPTSIPAARVDTPPGVIRSAGPGGRSAQTRVLDARPDTLDFRDRMFEPTLIEVQTARPLEKYLEARVPILDQGTEGACTGFGLATVVHYLLRTRHHIPDPDEVSPRMLYDMARRYDEWPGERYSGSSARGAMKGWHKHGVCSRPYWVYDLSKEAQDPTLFTGRYEDALRRPLGAYFRVNHKDLIAMHAAISEVGILYATAQVHEGWKNVGTDGVITWDPDARIIGGHAFAIVAYDQEGFWIQNSWADDWGKEGFARDLRRLARQRQRCLGGAARSPDRSAHARVGFAERRGGVARIAQLCVLRPAAAHHQPRQQRCVEDRRHLWHLGRGCQGDLRPDLHASARAQHRSSICSCMRMAASRRRTRRSRRLPT